MKQKLILTSLLGCLVAGFLLAQTAPVVSTQLSGKGLAIGPICVITNTTSGQLQIAACPAVPPPTTSYHHYTDLVPAIQSDGSYLVPNPLPGSTIDPVSISVYANGICLTSQPSSTQGTIDYTLDPSNPLHIIPSVQTISNWSTYNVRVSVGLSK